MRFVKTSIILLVIFLVFGALAFALNFLTGPIIEENNKGEFGDNELLYSPDAPGSLKDVAEQVLAIYKTADGFAIQLKTVGNYEKTPMKLTLYVNADGTIKELKVDEYTDSIDVREKDANFIPSFIGKDSALADVNLVSGCTFSSKSMKEAVEAGLNVLISNDLIKAGVKDDSQILLELIPTVFPDMGTPEDAGISTGNITAVYKAKTGVGCAYIVKDGEGSVLVIVNATGACKVYDVTGADVTASKTAAVTEVTTHFTSIAADYSVAANAKFASMVEGAGEMTPEILNTYNTLVYAASFTAGEQTYYGFYSRVFGFEQMEVYIVIDENGAIVKLDAKEFIFHKEYFTQLDPNHDDVTYKNGFSGLVSGDNVPMIGGATMTSNAVKTATENAFEAFESIKGGAQ